MSDMTTGNQERGGRGIGRFVYQLGLFAATVIWGISFFMAKDVVGTMGPATVVGIRFTVAALLMLAFFFKRIRGNLDARTAKVGLLLGALYFLGFLTQTIGITDTTPGKNAFLTAAYCVIVPFAYWAIARKRPSVVNVGAAVLCLVGIGLVSLDGSLTSISFGDGLTLVCAVFFALHIAVLGKYAPDVDVYTLAFLQFAVCGAGGLAVGLPTEAWPPAEALTPAFWAQLAYLAVFAAFAGCLLQNVGQAHVPPSQAGLILCLESVFGVLFSVLFYGEVLTARVAAGFAVIFVAIVLSETFADKEFTWRKRTT